MVRILCDRGFVSASLRVTVVLGGLVGMSLTQSPTVIAADFESGAWIACDGVAMTTRLRVEFWWPVSSPDQQKADASAGERLCQSALNEFHRVEAVMSSYREDTEVSRINREAAQTPVPISAELQQVIEQAAIISRWSEGAFDITFASAGRLYDYREGRRPDDRQLEEAVQHIDYRQVLVNPEEGTVRFGSPGVRIDLGGIAKGYSVEAATAMLQQHGVRHARVSAGGDMRLLGDRRGKPWIVGIRDPRAEESAAPAVVLPLSDVALSTSGDYERFFIEDGERVHHILSPRTGKPAGEVQSVSVLGADATLTDGLSTAVFVMGVERGLAMIHRLPGVDAIIIDAQHRLHYSQGLMPPSADQK